MLLRLDLSARPVNCINTKLEKKKKKPTSLHIGNCCVEPEKVFPLTVVTQLKTIRLLGLCDKALRLP